MRIGIDARFLTHPQPGGFKTYTQNLVRALADVDQANSYVLYVDRPPEPGCMPERPNFTHRVVPGGVPLVGMPAREQILLGRQARADRVDVLHCLCNTAPVRLKIPVITTLHDTIQVTEPQSFGRSIAGIKRTAIALYSRWTIKATAGTSRKLITVSEYEKQQIVHHLGVAPAKVAVTHLAPSRVFTSASGDQRAGWRVMLGERYGIHRPFILAVGYEPRKNIPLLLEAFAEVAGRIVELELVVVAAEPRRRAEFQQLAAARGLGERVVVFGGLAPDQLAVLYNLAKVFVFPSARESFGLPPLEALACGAVVVATKGTSIPEIVGDAALLVDIGTPQAIADVLMRALHDEELRRVLSRRGPERAASFSWAGCARQTLAVYTEAAA